LESKGGGVEDGWVWGVAGSTWGIVIVDCSWRAMLGDDAPTYLFSAWRDWLSDVDKKRKGIDPSAGYMHIYLSQSVRNRHQAVLETKHRNKASKQPTGAKLFTPQGLSKDEHNNANWKKYPPHRHEENKLMRAKNVCSHQHKQISLPSYNPQ